LALLLTERDVRAVLPMPDLASGMEDALTTYSAGLVLERATAERRGQIIDLS
jgi:hypothetical protein